ncbi:MAG: NAD(P)H-dependent flavin oxidoreductase [Parvibaculaceae bacterium]
MTFSKRITELLGIGLPIVQAPMAGAATPELAGAVSNAGGLGSLGVAMMAETQLREAVGKLRTLTGKPFNLNYFVHHEPELKGFDAIPMRGAMQAFYDEMDLGTVPHPKEGSPAFNDEALKLLLDIAPPVVSFHFGLPSATAIQAIKAQGIRILGCATTSAEARALEHGGADAIVAQGFEAGGHRGTFLDHVDLGQVGTMALVPQVVDAVKVPVIAAGGIGDARGIAAAFMLGADAVQLGTAYLVTPECSTHELHRKALRELSDHGTTVTKLFSGRPARAIRNRFTESLHNHEGDAAPFPTQRALAAPLVTASAKAGRAEYMQMWSGQAARLSVAEPAATKTLRLMRDAAALLGAR